MDFSQAMELGREAFWVTLITSAPILAIGLVVGLLISMFQAVTQLQEQTLTFVPKIVAMVIAGVMLLPWIARQMVAYSQELFGTLPW